MTSPFYSKYEIIPLKNVHRNFKKLVQVSLRGKYEHVFLESHKSVPTKEIKSLQLCDLYIFDSFAKGRMKMGDVNENGYPVVDDTMPIRNCKN